MKSKYVFWAKRSFPKTEPFENRFFFLSLSLSLVSLYIYSKRLLWPNIYQYTIYIYGEKNNNKNRRSPTSDVINSLEPATAGFMEHEISFEEVTRRQTRKRENFIYIYTKIPNCPDFMVVFTGIYQLTKRILFYFIFYIVKINLIYFKLSKVSYCLSM